MHRTCISFIIWAGIAQSVERQALGRDVLSSNPASASSPRSDIGQLL